MSCRADLIRGCADEMWRTAQRLEVQLWIRRFLQVQVLQQWQLGDGLHSEAI